MNVALITEQVRTYLSEILPCTGYHKYNTATVISVTV